MGLRTSEWAFAALDADGEPMRTFTDGEPSRLIAILACLSRRASLEATLAALPPNLVSQMAVRLGMQEAADTAAREDALVDLPPWMAEWTERVPGTTPRAVAWVLLTVACVEAGRGTDDIGSAFSAFVARQEAERRADRRLVADQRDGADDTIDDRRATSVDSAFGGIFYLLSIVDELTLGEILWRACLPEGRVIARAIGALIGEHAADPALSVLGGARHDEAGPSVSEEQQAEASVALCEALLWALPRRERAALPEPVVLLIDLADGRLLVASERGSPHMFFAAPARTPAETVTAIESFLALWPRSAPTPRAERALASLDRSARIAPLTDREPPCDPLRVEAGSLFASALMTQIAGTLGHLFAARVAVDPFVMVREHLAVPARLVRARSTLTIQIPMERIDLAVRRAGLDADPGWVPWLERRVTFEFVENASEDIVARQRALTRMGDTKAPEAAKPARQSRNSQAVTQAARDIESALAPQDRVGNAALARLVRSGIIQPKLIVSNPTDPDEREADAVADAVTSPRGGAVTVSGRVASGSVHRAKDSPDDAPRATSRVESSLDSLRGGGRPLPPTVRASLEPRFGKTSAPCGCTRGASPHA